MSNRPGRPISQPKLSLQYQGYESVTIDQITDIKALVGNAGPVEVNSIDSICVLRNAGVTEVRTLTPGIYIIDGKKCLLN